MKKINTIISALFLTCAANAADMGPKVKTARIDLGGKGTNLTVSKNVAHPSWIKDEAKKKKALVSNSKGLADDSWTDYELEFIPETDGMVSVALRGMWYKPKDAEKNVPVWVCFDKVEITGAEVMNGSFETLKENGIPENWSGGKADMVIKDKETASDGENYIKVHHNKAFYQTINVKQGQPVTIKAKVKAFK